MSTRFLIFALAFAALWAGPVDFGMEQFRAAASERNLNFTLQTDVNLDPPGSYTITVLRARSYRISGGDLRGLMYGLLEAADQLRSTGTIEPAHVIPAARVRGVRLVVDPERASAPGFFNEATWRAHIQALARSRMNRFTLVLPVGEVRPETLCSISEMSNQFGVDFVLGVEQPFRNADRYYAVLREVLSACVWIRAIEMEDRNDPAHLYKNTILRAMKEIGHRVALDLHGIQDRPEIAEAAREASIPLRIASDPRLENQAIEIHTVFRDARDVTDAGAVRKRVASIVEDGMDGFEIDTFDPELADQEAFLKTWGRLGQDPSAR